VFNFFENIAYLKYRERYSRGRQSTNVNIIKAHGACILHNKLHKQSFKLIHINCFPTATSVSQTNLDFTFISTLPILYIALIEI